MADRLENIAIATGASIQEHASAEADVVKKATEFLDNDVYHWLEASQADNQEPQGPVMTPPFRDKTLRNGARLSED